MQNIIKDQESKILELEHFKNKTDEELQNVKTQLDFKNGELKEWKQKYDVNKFDFY